MKFFVMGGTGFVGGYLLSHLTESGHEVQALTRSLDRELPEGVEPVVGNGLAPGSWQKEAGKADAVVNLLGENIFTRWNDKTKQRIWESRTISTRLAAECIPAERGKDMVLINANAVGYYGPRGDEPVAEDEPAGDDFLAELCKAWQAEAQKASEAGARVVILRIGVVLGRGGALAQMLPPFRLGLGGRLGSGKQYFPWIHVADLCGAIEFAAETREMSGPVNAVSPGAVNNKQFTKALGRVLKRPTLLPVPRFVLKIVMGEVADVITTGQRAVPDKLTRAGFKFKHPEIRQALKDILG